VYVRMSALEQELAVLERERHKEVQRRIVEKEKDEHRKAEYAQFCNIVDYHLVPLERTIRNMDVNEQAANTIEEIYHAGFTSLHNELIAREKILRMVKTETHKEHVEVVRGLLLELGEIVYKKERMVEETEKGIHQAHIQQELLAETFNPNAKKFGDIKKGLLLTRDDLESDVKELKERSSAALEGFDNTESQLTSAGVTFVHPLKEAEHQLLATRTRMLEVKALATGHVPGQRIFDEIAEIQASTKETEGEIKSINTDTSQVVAKTLPMVRSAVKSRVK